jgi:hypothetical protein
MAMRSCPGKGRGPELSQSPDEGGPPETASELAAEKVSAESIAAFAKRGAAARTEATKRLEADLGKLRDQLKAFKAGTINRRLSAAQMSENRFVLTQVKNRTVVVYPDEESKREQISKVEAAVARLDAAVKLVRDPKGGLASFLALAGPELAPNQVGDIGFLPELEVVQIAGSDEFHTYLGDLRVAVRGYDTAGIAKGSKVPGGVMYVCAVEHYRTVGGATNSVLVIRQFPADLLKTRLSAETGSLVKTAPAVATSETSRTWKDASGKFRVEAKFVGNSLDGKKVKLEKLDGTTIEVAITILSPSDQAFLRTVQPATP